MIITITNENKSPNLDIKSSSYLQSHLAIRNKTTRNTIPSFAVLSLLYPRNSATNMKVFFEPYTINLAVKIDHKILIHNIFIADIENKVINLACNFK